MIGKETRSEKNGSAALNVHGGIDMTNAEKAIDKFALCYN